MIVKHTFLDKCNTIIQDSKANFGLNPIVELYYGDLLSRAIIHFDHTELKRMVEDKTYPDMSKLKHVLKMTNASMIRTDNLNRSCLDITRKDDRIRAASFDLILFLIPEEWDNGKGFDYSQDIFPGFHRGFSEEGSNWYYRRSYCAWGRVKDAEPCENIDLNDNVNGIDATCPGIYSTDKLFKELDKLNPDNDDDDMKNSSIIVGYQHFDYGNENMEIDITDTVNKYITGEIENYGLCIAFSPVYEIVETCESQYVGFFSNRTNSFYKPYVETTYDDFINDDRSAFYLGKDNRLYFYASVGGDMVNLDEMPQCSVNGIDYDVKQATKGVYYIDINMSPDIYNPNTMYYDIWTNLSYRGNHINDVELYFTTKTSSDYFSFGLPSSGKEPLRIEPSLYGIQNKETVKPVDVRKVNIDCRIPYTSDKQAPVDWMEYRVYIKQGLSDIDVIPYTKVERSYLDNYFLIDTRDLVPCRYYVDIRIKHGMEELTHRNMLQFDIEDNRTEVKC